MKVKTRGNSSADRKSKVYFIACSGDCEKHFDLVADMILKRHNCAVYCNEPGEKPSAEELALMNLIVIGITGKFIHGEPETAHSVLKFAEEKYIPILPIILEKLSSYEIAKLNPTIKNRQCLNYLSDDETEISFNEKLSTFIKSVLISDELAEKIRASFDAYIFLSYRKIDRAYANRLMKLIHKNDFARDIAIWFDEFLTPGEDFNSSIKAALEKSDLFVLNVTPSLIDAPDARMNFVREHEYPMAVKSHKRIFPVEMFATDKTALEEQYKDIPVCADPNDEAAFSRMLLENLNGIANETNNCDPLHNFMIGLAYLEGIDVEKNSELAFGLIKGAAEAGLPEAMEKLADMYERGIGAAYNPEEALVWREKYAQTLEAAFFGMEEKTEEAGIVYGEAIYAFAYSYYMSGKDLGKACAYCFDAATKAKYLNNLFTSSVFRVLEAKCMELYADIMETAQKYDEAIKQYDSILDVYLDIIEKEFLKSGLIGKLQYHLIFSEGIIPPKLPDEIDVSGCVEEFKRVIFVVCKLCNIYLNKGSSKKIEKAFLSAELSLLLSRLLYNELGENQYKEAEIKSLIIYGDSYFKIKKYGSARECYGTAMRECEQLCKNSDEIRYKSLLFDATIKLAQAYGDDGMLDKGDNYYEMALDLSEELDKSQGSILSKVNHSYCTAKCCGFIGKRIIRSIQFGDVNEAEQLEISGNNAYLSACNILLEIGEMTTSISLLPENIKIAEIYRELCVFKGILGDYYSFVGNYDMAEYAYMECYELIEGFENELGDNRMYLNMAEKLCMLANTCGKNKKAAVAERCYLNSLSCANKAYRINRQQQELYALFAVNYCLSEFYSPISENTVKHPEYFDVEKALQYMEKALKCLDVLIAAAPDNKSYTSEKELMLRKQRHLKMILDSGIGFFRR